MARFRKKREEASAGFSGEGQAAARRPRLTPVDVQEKVFRLAFRGYSEREVDEFLDLVTEEIAALHEENKRLREELELRGPGGDEDARRHAEETVRRAREDAARIIAEAERATGGTGAGISAAFLGRERDFLQQLAGLVQEHADALRGEASRVRKESTAPASGPPPKRAPAGEPAAGSAAAEEAAASLAPGARVPRSDELDEHDQSEPSLKELFWGEE